jgi:tRNA pseudouridine55 synthase
MISKDVSRWLTKRVGKVKLGHVGTLDPSAEGVLPILLGRATRLQDFLLEMPKTYEFDMTFGSETDTLDNEGVVTATMPWEHITYESLLAATASFHGEIEQTPPMYSAVKFKGKALYEYARSGRSDEVPRDALKRFVKITHFDLLSYKDGVGTIRVTCSKGTYVRVLVKDIAAKLGSCATLTRLVRIEAAGVTLADTVQLESLESTFEQMESSDTKLDQLERFLVPMSKINLGMPKWRATNKAWIDRLAGGQQIIIDLEDFLSGLDSPGGAEVLASWAKPLLLLRETGEAFGMGSVRRQEAARVVISMKRGL